MSYADTVKNENDQLRARLSKANEELRKARLYLKGCMGHFFDETPVSKIAEDVVAEFHRGRIREQEQRQKIAQLEGMVKHNAAERDEWKASSELNGHRATVAEAEVFGLRARLEATIEMRKGGG